MAKLGELASPVMRSTTRLQRYPAPGMGCKEVQKLSSTDPLAKYRSTPLIRSVNVKDVLGDIQTDYDNFRHGRLPQVVSTPPLWHIDAVGGVHPIINPILYSRPAECPLHSDCVL
jgi:hypothetical protein